MSAETLFGMLAKFLPVENLHVEEIIERAPPSALPARPQLKLTKPKHKRGGTRGIGTRGGMDLTAGVNRVIMELLADNEPHRAAELKPLMSKLGYSPSGVGSRLNRLRDYGVIFQPEMGLWQLTRGPRLDTQTETAA